MRGRDENRTIIKFGFLIFMYVHDWMYMYLCSKLEGGTMSHLDEVINTTATVISDAHCCT